MFLAKVIRKAVKTCGLPKNSVMCILIVRFSSHVIHGMQHFKQPQLKIQQALTEIHQSQSQKPFLILSSPDHALFFELHTLTFKVL